MNNGVFRRRKKGICARAMGIIVLFVCSFLSLNKSNCVDGTVTSMVLTFFSMFCLLCCCCFFLPPFKLNTYSSETQGAGGGQGKGWSKVKSGEEGETKKSEWAMEQRWDPGRNLLVAEKGLVPPSKRRRTNVSSNWLSYWGPSEKRGKRYVCIK